MVKIKGNSLFLVKRYILDKYGKEEYGQIVSQCSDDTWDILNSAILSTVDYDWKAYLELITSFLRMKGKEALLPLSEYKCREQLNWLYKAMLKVTPWKIFVTNGQIIWNIHFAHGSAVGEFASEGSFVIHLSGIPFNKAIGEHFSHYMRVFYEFASSQKMECSYRLIDSTHLDLIYSILPEV